MIKVTVRETATAQELIEAFKGKDYDVEIVIKENTVGQDDVIKMSLECHLESISKISMKEELLIENPILIYIIAESLKTVSLTLALLRNP